mmetsp:Transcript_39391/g.103316  ORF Transcript_39391/g.103316 Transcript_39391/m.103316 type:complete len:87 (+) Transcript_39391:1892-2152(+)|eukprot:2300230-Prymnesium_polylepis.1
MLRALPVIGPPLFPDEWALGAVDEGDAKALRKAYHKTVARLHPDKVGKHSRPVQVMAEELFKVLTAAHDAEVTRLQGGSAAPVVAC